MKKNNTSLPFQDLLYSAKRSSIVYTDIKELTDIKNDKLDHFLSDFIKTEFANTNIEFISDEITDAQLYIWIKKNTCYITIRGTKGFKDILHDLSITSKQYKDNIYIHNGFFQQFSAIKDDIDRYILNNIIDIDNFIVAGHSLGGALAQIVAPYISENYFKNVSCHTFGSPRVGNAKFVEWFDFHIKDNYRVSNKSDIVSSIPIKYKFNHTMNGYFTINKKCHVHLSKHKVDTPWYKRLFTSLKLFNFTPKKDHSCSVYIERLEKIINKKWETKEN